MVGGGKVIKAEVPLAEMFGYATNLRSLTQGRATYTMEFKHYSEAPRTSLTKSSPLGPSNNPRRVRPKAARQISKFP